MEIQYFLPVAKRIFTGNQTCYLVSSFQSQTLSFILLILNSPSLYLLLIGQ